MFFFSKIISVIMDFINEISEDFTLGQIVARFQSTSDDQEMMDADELGKLETCLETIAILDDSSPSSASSSSEDLSNSNELQLSSGFLLFPNQSLCEISDIELGEVYREMLGAVQEPLPHLPENIMDYYDIPNPKKRKISYEDTSGQSNSNAVMSPSFYPTVMTSLTNAEQSTLDNIIKGLFRIRDPCLKTEERYCEYDTFDEIERRKMSHKEQLSNNLNNILDMVEMLFGELRCVGNINKEDTKKLFQYIAQEIQETENVGTFRLYKSYYQHRRDDFNVLSAPKYLKKHVITVDKSSSFKTDSESNEEAFGKWPITHQKCPVENIPDLTNNKSVTEKEEKRNILQPMHRYLLKILTEEKMHQQLPAKVHNLLLTHQSNPDYQLSPSDLETIYVRFRFGRFFKEERLWPLLA